MHVAPRAALKRIVAERMPFDAVTDLDRRLVALGRGLGAMRLWLGEGLNALEVAGGFKRLGFPTLASYAREALGMSGRWAADARTMARRLDGLVGLRSALVSGRLSWSKVERLGQVASSEDEEAWIERAESLTVRALDALIRDGVDEDDGESAPARSTITVTVDRVDAMAFEQARLMVRALGARTMDEAVEAMLAEGLTEMIARVPDLDLPSGVAGLTEYERAWREELARMRREGEEACEARGFYHDDEYLPVHVCEPTWPADLGGIDAGLRALADELAGRDLEIGHLARRVFESDAWNRLGYATLGQYLRERVGLSASSVKARIALSRRVAGLPEIEDALVSGAIGFEAAVLIARVAGPDTAGAWVERAGRRTVKSLREEIQAVEMVARVEDCEVTEMGPPDEETIEAVEDVERAVIATLTDGGQMCGGEVGDDDEAPVELPTQTLRLNVSEETGRFWRALERVYAGLWTSGSFVAFLAGAVGRAWGGTVARAEAGGEYADVYVRDRWRCRSPVCSSSNVTPHHIRFRSRGGGEGRHNLLSLCANCHLELVHGGALSVVGDAGIGGVLSWKAAGWAVSESGAARARLPRAPAARCRPG